MTKYRAKKVQDDGYTFDSKLEHQRYCFLKSMQNCRQIIGLTVHPKYPLVINGIDCGKVCLDFAYINCTTNQWVREDVKGVYTQQSKRIHRIFEAASGFTVHIVRSATAELGGKP